MRASFLLQIFLLIVNIALSQEDRLFIRGKVLDAKTIAPLSSATIEVKALSIEFISSLNGGFEL